MNLETLCKIANRKRALVDACEAAVAVIPQAQSTAEMEAYRNAAAHAGDAYRRATQAQYTDGDGELDGRVDDALDMLERVCGEFRATLSPYEKHRRELADLGCIV